MDKARAGCHAFGGRRLDFVKAQVLKAAAESMAHHERH
jgi:hypothetical protein